MLKDEAAAGRVIVPLRPFLKFSRKLDKQLGRLEKRIRRKVPQLKSISRQSAASIISTWDNTRPRRLKS
jgi:hypothetical protein